MGHLTITLPFGITIDPHSPVTFVSCRSLEDLKNILTVDYVKGLWTRVLTWWSKPEIGHFVSYTSCIHSHREGEKESFICHLAAVELWNWFQGLQLFNKDHILHKKITVFAFLLITEPNVKKNWQKFTKCSGVLWIRWSMSFQFFCL